MRFANGTRDAETALLSSSLAAQQHVECEGAAVGAGNGFKDVYCILYFVNRLQHPPPRISRVRRIVGLLSLALHMDESASKVLDLLRESPHSGQVVALVPCVSMLQCSVGLHPSRIAPRGTCQTACTAKGHGMKESVVGSAHGPSEFSLPGSAPAPSNRSRCQLPRNSQQIAGVHGICPGIRSLWILFHSDFSMNAWPAYKGHSSSGR